MAPWFLFSCCILRTLSDSVLCNQHHAEPCFALHHASVSISSLFERNCFNHRADTLEDTECKCVLAINRRARQAPVDRAPSKHERERIQLDLVLRHTHHDELPAGCKTGHKGPHRGTTGGCCENRSGSAHALQYRCGIVNGSVDVDVCAQIFRKLFLIASTPDCDSTESHVPRKLDAKMAKSTHALHSDQISAAQAGVANSVIGRDTRAEERSGFCGCEFIWNRSQGACFSDHHFRISSVRGHSRYHRVLTIHTIPASARFAHPVFSGNEADTNPLTDFPSGHPASKGFNAANHFMSGHARQSQTGVDSRHRGSIGVTDSTCFHPNADLTCSGLGDLPFHYSKHAGCGDFDCFVRTLHLCVPPRGAFHSG